MILTFIMLLLSTTFWISEKISCMVCFSLPEFAGPLGVSLEPRSAGEPGAVLSGSMLSGIWRWRHRRQGWCHILAFFFPHVCLCIMTELPVLSLLHQCQILLRLTVARRVGTVNTRMCLRNKQSALGDKGSFYALLLTSFRK